MPNPAGLAINVSLTGPPPLPGYEWGSLLNLESFVKMWRLTDGCHWCWAADDAALVDNVGYALEE